MFALFYLTLFGTLVAFACWFYLLKHLRLSTCTTLSFVTPLIALAMDASFEKNIVFSTETNIGIAIVLIGATATVWRRVRAG
jgi:drug/metabolite transporter (DMT)-like permease